MGGRLRTPVQQVLRSPQNETPLCVSNYVTPGTCALADWVLWIGVGSEPLRVAPFQIQSTKCWYTKFLTKF